MDPSTFLEGGKFSTISGAKLQFLSSATGSVKILVVCIFWKNNYHFRMFAVSLGGKITGTQPQVGHTSHGGWGSGNASQDALQNSGLGVITACPDQEGIWNYDFSIRCQYQTTEIGTRCGVEMDETIVFFAEVFNLDFV